MKKIGLIALACGILVFGVRADEGMWMLPLIKKLNIKKMEGLGLSLTAEEIYSHEHTSLKDAVVIFDNGCTGVMVSPSGLLFTNHHCGYSAIQQLSSVQHNYLKDGFTANELHDELPCKGVSVTFLVDVEDVTAQVMEAAGTLTGKARKEAIERIIESFNNEKQEVPYRSVQVKSFYSGNEYYRFVYEQFNDVRLAYTPPSSIGKFGGETDNWMYPRHTGDFAVFRVYADKNGKPADYAQSNVPYTPKRFAVISNQGFKEGDYAMILGNPGSTDRYATSFAINNRVRNGNAARIAMRGVKQEAWKKHMLADEAVNIAYANKYANSSNYWKNSIGMNNAIKRLHVIRDKERLESEFAQWVDADAGRKSKYGHILAEMRKAYMQIDSAQHAIDFLRESLLNGVELPRIAINAKSELNSNATHEENVQKVASYYKDYYPEVDRSAFTELLKAYRQSVTSAYLPDVYKTIDKKYKGDYNRFTADLFKKSVFTTPEKLAASLKKSNYNYTKDPAIVFYNDIQLKMSELKNKDYELTLENIVENRRLYEAGLKEWAVEKGTPMYPDANFTMRLTYGQALGYRPADAAYYRYYTTPQGILEKEDPANPEFVVPEKLKAAILRGDYGHYIDKNTGEMHVAFVTNNDITGGNSGSPVFNAKGEVIGLAFDGNWEAMSGDIIFEPNLQRCINVDIRYVLWVMDKVGGAERLIKELKIR